MKKIILSLLLTGSFIWGGEDSAPLKNPLLMEHYTTRTRVTCCECDKDNLKSESIIEDFISLFSYCVLNKYIECKYIFKDIEDNKNILALIHLEDIDIHLLINYESNSVFMNIFCNEEIDNEMLEYMVSSIFVSDKTDITIYQNM